MSEIIRILDTSISSGKEHEDGIVMTADIKFECSFLDLDVKSYQEFLDLDKEEAQLRLNKALASNFIKWLGKQN